MGQGARPFNNTLLEGIQTGGNLFMQGQANRIHQQQADTSQQGMDIDQAKYDENNAPVSDAFLEAYKAASPKDVSDVMDTWKDYQDQNPSMTHLAALDQAVKAHRLQQQKPTASALDIINNRNAAIGKPPVTPEQYDQYFPGGTDQEMPIPNNWLSGDKGANAKPTISLRKDQAYPIMGIKGAPGEDLSQPIDVPVGDINKSGSNKPMINVKAGGYYKALGQPMPDGIDENDTIQIPAQNLPKPAPTKPMMTVSNAGYYKSLNQPLPPGVDPNGTMQIPAQNLPKAAPLNNDMSLAAIKRSRGIEPDEGDENQVIHGVKPSDLFSKPGQDKGEMTYGQLFAARGQPVPQGIDSEEVVPGAKAADLFPKASVDNRSISPPVQQWYKNYQAGKATVNDFPALDKMSTAESALKTQANAAEQNSILRNQQQTFHQDTLQNQQQHLDLAKKEFQTHEDDKHTVGDKDGQALAAYQTKFEQLQRISELAHKLNPNGAANAQTTGENILSSLSGGLYTPSERAKDLNEYNTLLKSNNLIENMTREGVKMTPAKSQMLQSAYQITPSMPPAQVDARIRGQLDVWKSTYEGQKAGISAKTPKGIDPIDQSVNSAYNNLKGTVGAPMTSSPGAATQAGGLNPSQMRIINTTPRPSGMSDSDLIKAGQSSGKSPAAISAQLHAWKVKGY